MSIASEIQRIKNNIANAYTNCSNKGATIPSTQNCANLATCINSIPTGITPTGTLNITENGTVANIWFLMELKELENLH